MEELEKLKKEILDQANSISNFNKITLTDKLDALSCASIFSFWAEVKSLLNQSSEKIKYLENQINDLKKDLENQKSLNSLQKQSHIIIQKELSDEIEMMKSGSNWYEKYEIADEIISSEQFMWLMAGSNHVDSNLEALRPAFNAWRKAGGKSWGKR